MPLYDLKFPWNKTRADWKNGPPSADEICRKVEPSEGIRERHRENASGPCKKHVADCLADYCAADANATAMMAATDYCTCTKPTSKPVVLSKTLQYDFCTTCKKEVA